MSMSRMEGGGDGRGEEGRGGEGKGREGEQRGVTGGEG